MRVERTRLTVVDPVAAGGLHVNELFARFMRFLDEENEPATTVAELRFAFRPPKSL